jgi:ABC-type Fe3+-hydroxamate transport system substrate-binding protein
LNLFPESYASGTKILFVTLTMFLSEPPIGAVIPNRIVSLVPSQTELLFDLDLDSRVAGITRFCVHPPEWLRDKPRIGGTKALDPDKIRSLNPDLIIANKEENVKEQVEGLAKDYPVWVTDVNDVDSALGMIRDIGQLTRSSEKANQIADSIMLSFKQLRVRISNAPKPRVAYMIWKDPYMTVGGDTFISSMLSEAGFINVFRDRMRYPEITVEDIRKEHCEVVLLSSEPYPFSEKHISSLASELPGCRILLADGEMFSWYGSRMLRAADYFLKIRSLAGF